MMLVWFVLWSVLFVVLIFVVWCDEGMICVLSWWSLSVRVWLILEVLLRRIMVWFLMLVVGWLGELLELFMGVVSV